ncbi:MAG: AAA family ATPase [Polaribacter sp.]|uniref:AAA family ATPase n=1 Tax=Polaribacter sp. TaxID=1920175 RepID=UPI003EF24C10
MKKITISRFKIEKLFGYQDVNIEFNSNHIIIIGENGLGKTTVLNCLYYILEKKFKKLNNIKFESIELQFSNKKKVSFTKNDLDFYVKKPRKYQSSQFYQLLKDDLSKKNLETLKSVINDKKYTSQEKRFTVVRILNDINININAPSQFIYDNINKLITESETINFQNISETLDSIITSKILYFPTYRRIESQLDTLQKNISSSSEYYNNPFLDEDEYKVEYDDIIQFGMNDVKEKIDYITEEISQKSLIGFSKITGDLLSQLSNEFQGKISRRVVDEKKVRIILDRVSKSITEEDKSNIIDYIKSGKRTNKGLLFFIDQLINLYNEQEELDIAIKQFVTTCNSYLNRKNFHYNESEISLEIFRENTKEVVDLDQLSSGEKQIVSLFSKIYLDLNKSFIVLFDEPELSLSIFWQEKLLPDIIKSGKCNFLFAVTHSPFIYENELLNNTIGLDQFISKIE